MGIPRPRVNIGNKVDADVSPIQLIGGVNTAVDTFNVSMSESVDSRNTSTRKGNLLSSRLAYTTYAIAPTWPKAVGVYNNTSMHVVDSVTWKKWNGTSYDTIATVTNAEGTFLEFNTEAKRYMVLFNGTDKKSWDGTTVVDLTAAPATSLIAVDDFRLYGLLGSVLKCSAEASLTDWTTANDADSMPITDMIGPGTAIAAWNDTIICWSAQTMHILYGNDPYDFYLSNAILCGCISNKSIVTDDKYLYFLDKGKFKRYLSGSPQDISQKVKKYLEAIPTAYESLCASGRRGQYIYLSIPYGNVAVNNLTLEYDTEKNTWQVWDKGFRDFFNIGNILYGQVPTGGIWDITTDATLVQTSSGAIFTTNTITLTDTTWNAGFVSGNNVAISECVVKPANNKTTTFAGTPTPTLATFPGGTFAAGTETDIIIFTRVNETINWYHITPMIFNNFHKINIDSIPIVINLPIGNTFKIACNTKLNTEIWTDIYTCTATEDLQNLKIEVPITYLNDVDYFQLKFYGTGACDIYFVGLDKRISER